MANEKFHKADLIMGAMQLLTIDGLKRFDTEFYWKGEIWKFSAYKISAPVNLIRIDLRKQESPKKPKKPAKGAQALKRPMG